MASPLDFLPGGDEETDAPAPTPTTTTQPPAPAPTSTSRPGSALSFLDGGTPTPSPAPQPAQEPLSQPQLSPEDESVVRGAELLEKVWEQQTIPSARAREIDEKAAEQVTDLLNFMARAWAVADTIEDDEEADGLRQLVTDTLGMGREVFTEEEVAALGLAEAWPEDPGFFREFVDNTKGAVGWALGGNPVGRTITPVLEAVGEIGEGFALAIGETGRAIAGEEGYSLLDAADYAGSGIINALPGTMAGEQDISGFDQDGDGAVNMREIIGLDSDLGGDSYMGLFVGALDTIGLAAVDPTSYVGIGIVGRARAGVEAAERVGGAALAREVMENGTRNLDNAVVDAIEAEVRRGVTEAFEGGRRMTLMERLRRMDQIEAQQNQVTQRMGQIETPTGRLSFAGRDIRSPLDTIAENNPLRRQYGELTEAGNVLDTAASGVRRDIAQIFGEGVDEVTETANGLRVTGRITHRGKDIGSYTRQLLDDGTAIFDHSGIDEAFRGRGHATRFLDNQVEALADQGFHTIKMVAEGDGALVWGRRGFEFDVEHPQFGPSMQSLAQRLRMKADELQEGVLDTVAEYDGDAQLDAMADEGIGMFQGGNPDDLRMLADEIEIAMRNGMYDLLPDPSDARWASLAGVVDDTMGFPMVRYIDDVANPGRVRRFLDDPDQYRGQAYTAPVTRRSAVDMVPEGIRRQGDRIRPRAAIKRDGPSGRSTERLVDDIRVETEGVSTRQFNEMADELNASATAAAEEFAGGVSLTKKGIGEALKDADQYVRAVLEGDEQLAMDLFGMTKKELDEIDPSDFAEMAAKQLELEDMPALAEYVRDADKWRSRLDDAAVRAGLETERLRRFYMPRTLTREGRQAVQENASGIQTDLGRPGTGSTGEFGFQSERGFRPSDSIEDLNAHLATEYGLKPGTKVFEDSVLASFAARGRSAFRAATEADLIDGLRDEIVDGTPLAVLADGSKAAKAAKRNAGYTDIVTPAGTYYMPKAVADAFEQVRNNLSSDEWVRGFQEFRRNWSQVWGANATSPLIDGIGFHSRNAQGNLMLNALAGVVNPADYRQAMRLQRAFGAARKRVRQGDSTWDSVWSDMGLSDADAAVIRGLQDHDIMGSGFFDDIGRGTSQRGKIYEALGNNVMIRSGRRFGTAVEENARIAHYINKLNAPGGTPASAARSVRQFLFDYGDLTEFERTLRHVSRFYTFMRKNTGVQMWALAHYPGRVAGLERAVQSPLADSERDSGLGLDQAGYSRLRGDTIVNPLGMGGTVASVDTPFGAAVDTLAPLVEAANLIPGVREVVPGESNQQRLIESLYNLTAGGERAFADAVYESLTGKDIFTGRELNDEDFGAEATFMRWLDVAIGPAYSQLDRFLTRITEGEEVMIPGTDIGTGMGNNASTTEEEIGNELLLLSNLLGLNAAPQGERQMQNNLYAILREYEELARSGGWPTATDLRSAGNLPERPDSPDRARSVTLMEDIQDLQAQGLDTSALEAELAEQLVKEERLGYEIDPETGEYTSHEQRLKSFALGLGPDHTTESGEGSTSTLTKVLWNEENPDDPFLDDDGTPLDEYDVPVRWYETSENEVKEWAERTGATLSESGNVNRATMEEYNAANPSTPYYGEMSQRERAEAGLTPIQGVFVYTDEDGQVIEVRSTGSGVSALGGSAGRSALDDILGN